jgi:hypothetical protein
MDREPVICNKNNAVVYPAYSFRDRSRASADRPNLVFTIVWADLVDTTTDMCERERPVTAEGIDKVLGFLPIVEGTTRKLWTWPENDDILFSGPVYSDEVLAFERALYEEGFIIPFDWTKWQPTAERLTGCPELLAEVDLVTLQRLLTTHVRKERFCAGHLASVLGSGHICAVLHRLRAIRETLSEPS